MIKLLKQYPKATERVRWLDFSPQPPNWGSNFGLPALKKMSSLRLITVKWGFGMDNQAITNDRIAATQHTLVRLRLGLGKPDPSSLKERVKLAVIFTSHEFEFYNGNKVPGSIRSLCHYHCGERLMLRIMTHLVRHSHLPGPLIVLGSE